VSIAVKPRNRKAANVNYYKHFGPQNRNYFSTLLIMNKLFFREENS